MVFSESSQPAQSSAEVKEQSQGQQEEYQLPTGINLEGRKAETQAQVRKELEAVSDDIGNRMDKDSASNYIQNKIGNRKKLNRRNAADAVCMQTLINTLLPDGEKIQVDGRYFGESIAACKTIQGKVFDKYAENHKVITVNDTEYTREKFCDGIFGNDTYELYDEVVDIDTETTPVEVEVEEEVGEEEGEGEEGKAVV